MIIRADARMIPLQNGCVQTVVTSPPYYGLRDYGSSAQIGLEPTPDAYVASLVAVFAEVWRVLRDDGTVWLNLGDCYAGSGRGGYAGGDSTLEGTVDGQDQSRVARGSQLRAGLHGKAVAAGALGRAWVPPPLGLKQKDLVGIPWRVAFALQAAGWYLRSDIIWAKPNPMPESCRDRPTTSHEHVFLLSKSSAYRYDAAAIAEPVSDSMLTQVDQGYDGLGLKDYDGAGVQNPSSVKARIIANAKNRLTHHQENQHSLVVNVAKARANGGTHDQPFGLTRNRRTVWTIPTSPYAGAHFATMPPALVEPCILAGCPLGGLVLDPFVGSGTVGAVAERLGRRWVGVDLSYQGLAQARTAQRGIQW